MGFSTHFECNFRLIQDLFPGVSAETKLDPEFEKIVRKVAKSKGLQADDGEKTTLETSGEDVKVHSKRVEKV